MRVIRKIFATIIPKTNYNFHYAKELKYTPFVTVETVWIGVTLQRKTFEVANSKGKESVLRELLKMGNITQEEYKEYLSPL